MAYHPRRKGGGAARIDAYDYKTMLEVCVFHDLFTTPSAGAARVDFKK